jgi:Tol biopolymer transport system component
MLQSAAAWLALRRPGLAAPSLLVKQKSVPEALVPTTSQLLFHEPAQDGGITIERFRMQGELAVLSPDHRRIAYDCKHHDGYYNIHLCRVDGTDDRCITTLNNGLPHRHAGSPDWHPSGRYIVFTAEKRTHPGGSIEAIPGFGGHSDVWVITPDGRQAWNLTDIPDVSHNNVIIPRFSPDGTRLIWCQRRAESTWRPSRWHWDIKIAEFDPDGPRLANVQSLDPCGPGFYESYGLSPDGRRLIFMKTEQGHGPFVSQIYTADAHKGGDVQQLTHHVAWNEHASYTPDGRHIVWMTSQDNRNHGTDWWLMRADGSRPRRLTRFNDPTSPEGDRRPVYALLPQWFPDGRRFLGGIQYSLIKQEGRIVLVSLDASVFDD